MNPTGKNDAATPDGILPKPVIARLIGHGRGIVKRKAGAKPPRRRVGRA